MVWSERMERKCSRAKAKRSPPERPSKWLYALRMVRWSLCPTAKPLLAASAASRLSKGERKGERPDRMAAMVSASSATPKIAPSRRNLPMRTSVGRVARCWPRGVSRSPAPSVLPSSSSASSSTSIRSACSTAGRDGGSSSCSQTAAAQRSYLSALIVRTSRSSGTRRISGCWCASATWSKEWLVLRWKATPGRTRPARPRRCLALARETSTSSSDSILRAGSYRFSFIRAQSTTKTTSSMVTDVSAMFVASTTLRTPAGGRSNTRRWSSGGSVEWSGSSHARCGSAEKRGVASSASCTAWISLKPGKKTSTASAASPSPRRDCCGAPPSPPPPPPGGRSNILRTSAATLASASGESSAASAATSAATLSFVGSRAHAAGEAYRIT
mmetsp:Transcript_14939/g.48466  ORF Transcript_14939/g.48466 Transcript_14939/m.48466 type:complete len:386 (+) Transcript_14939:305-1462(+)